MIASRVRVYGRNATALDLAIRRPAYIPGTEFSTPHRIGNECACLMDESQSSVETYNRTGEGFETARQCQSGRQHLNDPARWRRQDAAPFWRSNSRRMQVDAAVNNVSQTGCRTNRFWSPKQWWWD